MSIAPTVRTFLEQHGVQFDIVPHAPAGTSSERAQAAHVPGARLAKSVVVQDEDHYAVVVLPATDQVHLGELRRQLGDTYALATEEGLTHVFADCDEGSVPPFGQAYGLDVLVDDSLLDQERIYAEGGDRAALVAIRGEDFRELMKDARKGHFGQPA